MIGIFCVIGLLIAAPLYAQSPANLRIAFCAWGPENVDLCVSDAAGQVRILIKSHYVSFPYFSPDGQYLFFTQQGKTRFGRAFQICRFNLKTQQVERISDGSAEDQYAVCSPDGKRLAFVSRLANPTLKGSDYRIYFSDLEGKHREAMDLQEKVSELFPSWSPRGDQIVYTNIKVPWSGLKVRDLKHKTVINLVPFYFYPTYASWSPTGDRIAFTSWNPLTGTHCIWIVKADGSDRYRLTDGPDDKQPSWFPDGTRLVFTRKDGEQKGLEQRGIYAIDLKTRKITKVVSIKNYRLLYPRIFLVR